MNQVVTEFGGLEIDNDRDTMMYTDAIYYQTTYFLLLHNFFLDARNDSWH